MNRERGSFIPSMGFDGAMGLLWYVLLALLPALAWIIRGLTGVDIPYQNQLVFHILVMLSAMSASYTEGFSEHLNLSLGLENREGRFVRGIVLFRDGFASFVLLQFFVGALETLLVAFLDEKIAGIPIQVFIAFLPLGFAGILFHWFSRAVNKTNWWVHLIAVVFGLFCAFPSLVNISYVLFPNGVEWMFAVETFWYASSGPIMLICAVLSVVLAPAGLPLFIVLGGLANFLFLRNGIGPGVILYEGYSVLDNNAIVAIALFTLTGFFISESKASKRFIEVFLSLFAWLPGGIVVAAIIVSAVFTTFTGASGVTILALGGLLFAVLNESGQYSKRFSVGILTSSGSVGLLFPPSLAIILYGSIAGINIKELFIAGLIPGAIMVLSRSLYGVAVSVKRKTPVIPFSLSRALRAVKDAFWELLIPLITIVLYFSGLATLMETAAVALLYTVAVETIIKREMKWKDMARVALQSMRVIGGVLIILMLAKGLSTFIIDAQIPQNLAIFISNTVSSKIVFVLLLNIALLITGMLMDIYSAIFVVVPLILPLGQVFGINPVHLGIIFLANLELGFITPPVGLNLFLGSYRFEMSLTEVYKSVAPFLLLQFGVVLLITFIPELSLLFLGAG